ncbi:MAG TPA: hypothetical protein VKB57_00115 [Acidimicrobiales bacterium]|nr:hypothetical protein [Acidimicrobiales bacterium]
MRRAVVAAVVLVMALMTAGPPAGATPISGAIFTTVANGTEVNFNIYPSKEAVYLDGGPGVGAPQEAAGLDDGTYVFEVTSPSGKALLSTDPARCRQFTVAGGIITGVVATGCQHVTGSDVDHGATTVQLMPYLDTPNNGGEYKVLVTRVADFLAGCALLGQNDGLNVVDCGYAGGNLHGFVPSDSKSDNFKVGKEQPREIDTRFFADRNGNGDQGPGEPWLLGRSIRWTDPVGASNTKWSDYAPELMVFNEAHVEAVEVGTHHITIADQAGCTVGDVFVGGVRQAQAGPQTVSVDINKQKKELTVFVDVACV